jgi:ectoine hydroxylase
MTTLTQPQTASSKTKWSAQQLAEYDKNGFVLVRGLLSPAEIARLTSHVPEVLNGKDEEDGMHRERERSGAPRSVFLAHRHSPVFKELARHPRILNPVKQILENDVYIWHSKINVKDAFEGTVWLWHQDYGYWIKDGIEDRLVSVMVFLDRSTLNNGCFMLAAGSHKWGNLPHYSDSVTTSYKQWCVEIEPLKKVLKEEAISPIIGNPGDVLFFHSNILHGSGHNMSPLPRKTMILVYNDITNKPRPVENPRPDWVVSREFEIVA